ncbi:hypothetical protein EWE75_17030 [Sphingomonas populi]|uniref:Response receiver domain-containing protein n=1 Tax=Sphingomonas populi TaxID=2484750 RepID=A0A4Q6XSL7_9SPHN|nr:response regulator receiver domain [Sphingomonas populi]RZF63250.1 hypothetical protein EWE75_17030 [Sphingomonas populi]
MADPTTYDEAVVETLRKRAVQSAILIDDSFPSYNDLLVANDPAAVRADFPDVDEARRLYALMHKNRIVCDIENSVDSVDTDFIDKIRKSDLVVLDWNLKRADPNDSEDAVRLLHGLSTSPHFNLVIIYTRDDLMEVWTRAAVRLRSGWREKEAWLDGVDLGSDRDPDELIGKLDPDGRVELITDEMLRQYVLGGIKGVSGEQKLQLGLFNDHGVPRASTQRVLEAMIHRRALRAHGAPEDAGEPRAIEGEAEGSPPYLNAGSVFVCMMKKAQEPMADEAGILECLDKALVAWKPSVLQLLVSELQNELEHRSYAFDSTLMPSNLLKAGWMFHMLREYGNGEKVAVDSLVASLNARLAESIEGSIQLQLEDPNSRIMKFGRVAARLSVEAMGDISNGTEIEVVEAAAREAGLKFNDKHDIGSEVLHALNEYLSSDVFRGGHMTTGTVLCSEDGKEWWMCVTPACDMVPRMSSDGFSWHAALHPFQPVTLLKLEPSTAKQSLPEAERGTQVFASTAGKQHFLRATHAKMRQPRPITWMLEPQRIEGGKPWQRHGFVFKEMGKAAGVLAIEERKVFAVSQLRPQYAARFLHLLSSHQSRIGVDYARFGKPADEGTEDGAKGDRAAA